MSIRPWRDIERRKSRQIMVGSVPVGGDAPISVQTMTNTPTEDAAATIDQIRRCQFVLIAKDRGQSPRDHAMFGDLADKRRGHSKSLQLAVQPVGQLLVLMAIAEEGEIAVAGWALAFAAKRRPHGVLEPFA